jgi:tetratricopeptide (TPR) repeat protein
MTTRAIQRRSVGAPPFITTKNVECAEDAMCDIRAAGRRVSPRARVSLCRLGCIGLLALCAPGARAAAQDAVPPAGSRREARMLEQAQALASTNAVAALTFMEGQALSEAGAAWHFMLGNLRAQTDRSALAVKSYEKALELFPSFRAAKINLGRVHLLREQPEPALDIYRSLMREGPVDAEVLLLLGHAALMAEHWLSAENAYRQVLLLNPGEPDALRGLIQCLMRQERWREAEALLREWLSVEPQRGELWAYLANVRLALDRTESALVALESARRLGRADADMLATLGDLYMNREQYEDAMIRYTEAFAGREISADRLMRAARAYVAADRVTEAEQLLAQWERRKRVSGSAPESAAQRRVVALVRMEIAMARAEFASAQRMGETLLPQNPLDGDLLLLLGDAYRQTDDGEKAALFYERAARLPEYEASARIRHAQMEIERKRYRAAAQLLEDAQRFDPQPHIARYLSQVRRLAEMADTEP